MSTPHHPIIPSSTISSSIISCPQLHPVSAPSSLISSFHHFHSSTKSTLHHPIMATLHHLILHHHHPPSSPASMMSTLHHIYSPACPLYIIFSFHHLLPPSSHHLHPPSFTSSETETHSPRDCAGSHPDSFVPHAHHSNFIFCSLCFHFSPQALVDHGLAFTAEAESFF